MKVEPIDEVQSKILDSLAYVEERLLRIRFSETGLDEHIYFPKNLVGILRDPNNLLASAHHFSVNSIEIPFFSSNFIRKNEWFPRVPISS